VLRQGDSERFVYLIVTVTGKRSRPNPSLTLRLVRSRINRNLKGKYQTREAPEDTIAALGASGAWETLGIADEADRLAAGSVLSQKNLVSVRGRWVMTVTGVGPVGAWSWSEIRRLAQLQIEKCRAGARRIDSEGGYQGTRVSGRNQSIRMLIGESALPGEGWSIVGDTMSWPVGSSIDLWTENTEAFRRRHDAIAAELDRANEIGLMNALRSWQCDAQSRHAAVIVTPLRLESDTQSVITQLLTEPLMTPRNEPVTRREVADVMIGDVDAMLIDSEHLHDGHQCRDRTIVGAVGNVVFRVVCSEHSGEAWSWPEVESVAREQIKCINRCIG
jgi:hypothetical protein